MLFRAYDINKLDHGIIGKYYNSLSDKRKAVISSMVSGHERAVALTSEMLARSLLSEMLDAPEFSFELLLSPNGRSAVANYGAFVSIASCADTVACAVSEKNVGVALSEIRSFSFGEAQSRFTDGELRSIYSEAGYSFAELIKMPLCTQRSAVEKFALYSAAKSAYNRCRGRTAGESFVEVSNGREGLMLSDAAFSLSLFGEIDNIKYCVVEKQ